MTEILDAIKMSLPVGFLLGLLSEPYLPVGLRIMLSCNLEKARGAVANE